VSELVRIVICRHSPIHLWRTMSSQSRRRSLQRTEMWRSRLQQKQSYWWLKRSEMLLITRRKSTS